MSVKDKVARGQLSVYKAVTAKYQKFPLPIGFNVCQVGAYTVSEAKAEIDQALTVGYQEITLTVSQDYNVGTWVYTRTATEIKEIIDYIKSKGVNANLKIHSLDAREMKEALTLDIEAWKTEYLAYITAIVNTGILVQYVYVLNECGTMYEDVTMVTWINEVITLLKTIGRAGISFSEFPGVDRCLNTIKDNLQVIGVNHYPVASSEAMAQIVTIDDMVESFSVWNPKEWIETQNRLYPNTDVTITEIGCPTYWENYAFPALTLYEGKTLTDSNGESTARYLNAFIKLFKNCNVKGLAVWYSNSHLTSPVLKVLEYWKGV